MVMEVKVTMEGLLAFLKDPRIGFQCDLIHQATTISLKVD